MTAGHHLNLSGIGKSFPGVVALSGVDFEAKGGEIHALLGANGAGKSTLMKVISGAYSPDEGTMTLDGKPVSFKQPLDAIRSGIHCVYQEVDTALVPGLDVTENIFLDELSQGKGWISWRALAKRAEKLLGEFGLHISPRKKVEDLSIPQKQMILIARALVHEAKFVIFDEPTAPLSGQECEKLYGIIQRLKAQGVSCLFITHRLPEVFALTDRITVLRDGKKVATLPTTDTSADEVVRLMLGKSLEQEVPKRTVPIGETLLEVRELSRGTKVHNASFEVRQGEVVGIFGLVGAGKTELSRLIFGADRADKGEIRSRGKLLTLRSPRDAVRSGIALVPEERRKQGVLVEETISVNVSLPSMNRVSRLGFFASRKERQLAKSLIDTLQIVPADPEAKVRNLSGGNQQKVAVGKWIPTDADVYLFDEPTKGVDVGAKTEIFTVIGNLAGEGKGIVYFSCEIEELLGIADRILIMSYGRIVKELKRGEADPNNVMLYASAGGELQNAAQIH